MLFCKKGTLGSTTPSNVFSPGLASKLSWKIAPDNQNSAAGSKLLPGFDRFTAMATTPQVTMADLANFISVYCMDNGCDTHVVLSEKTAANLYRAYRLGYISESQPFHTGFKFKYTLDALKREVDIEASLKLSKEISDVILEQYYSGTKHAWLLNSNNGYAGKGIKPSKLHGTEMIELLWDDDAYIIQREDLTKRTLTMEDVGDENLYGQRQNRTIKHTFEIISSNPDFETYRDIKNKIDSGIMPAVIYTVRATKDIVEQYVYDPYSLGWKCEVEQGSEKAEMQLSVSGEVPVADHVFNFGDVSNPVITVTA